MAIKEKEELKPEPKPETIQELKKSEPFNIMESAKSDVKLVYEKPDMSPLMEKMDKIADALIKPKEEPKTEPQKPIQDEKTAWDLMGDLI